MLVHVNSNILIISYKTNVHVAHITTLDKVVDKRKIEKCKMEIISTRQ